MSPPVAVVVIEMAVLVAVVVVGQEVVRDKQIISRTLAFEDWFARAHTHTYAHTVALLMENTRRRGGGASGISPILTCLGLEARH